MELSHCPGTLKRFRRTPWRFQQTFSTPLDQLPRFVTAILSTLEPLDGGNVTIDAWVFEPRHLKSLLHTHALTSELGHDWSIAAEGPSETAAALEAALGDWVDFLFVPTPKPFVIYADHDEYTTLFASTQSNLNRVKQALLTGGFESVTGYEREF